MVASPRDLRRAVDVRSPRACAVWRARSLGQRLAPGADSATRITFSKDVLIEGKRARRRIPLWLIPQYDWTVDCHFSRSRARVSTSPIPARNSMFFGLTSLRSRHRKWNHSRSTSRWCFATKRSAATALGHDPAVRYASRLHSCRALNQRAVTARFALFTPLVTARDGIAVATA